MIAAALKWQLDEIKVETVKPVIAQREVRSEAIMVKKGQVLCIVEAMKLRGWV
jgi:hypothetical protein